MMPRGRHGPVILGVTGGLGTGKSTVAKLLGENKRVVVLDADAIAHDVIQPRKLAWRQIVDRFGADLAYNKEDARIDRKKLAAVVFDDPEALRDLEAIVHPRVLKQLKERLAKLRRELWVRLVVVDVPLLFEANAQDLVDHVVVVTAPPEVVRKRLRERGMSEDDTAGRQAAQMDLEAKVALADTVIDNSGGLEKTRRQVTELWDHLVNTPRPRPRGTTTTCTSS
jgi:dephospho-CoA kinase